MSDLVKLHEWINALSMAQAGALENPPVVDLALGVVQAELGRALATTEAKLAACEAEEEAAGYGARYGATDATLEAWPPVAYLRAARDAVASLGLVTPLRRPSGGLPVGEAIITVLNDRYSGADLVRATVAAVGPGNLVLVPALVQILLEADGPCPPFSLQTRHQVVWKLLQQIGPGSLDSLLAIVLGSPAIPPDSVQLAVKSFGDHAVVALCAALVREPAGEIASDWIIDMLCDMLIGSHVSGLGLCRGGPRDKELKRSIAFLRLMAKQSRMQRTEFMGAEADGPAPTIAFLKKFNIRMADVLASYKSPLPGSSNDEQESFRVVVEKKLKTDASWQCEVLVTEFDRICQKYRQIHHFFDLSSDGILVAICTAPWNDKLDAIFESSLKAICLETPWENKGVGSQLKLKQAELSADAIRRIFIPCNT